VLCDIAASALTGARPTFRGSLFLLSACVSSLSLVVRAPCHGVDNFDPQAPHYAVLQSKPIGVNLTLLPALAPPNYQAYADVIVEEKIKIIETAGASPEKWIKFFKSHGCIVMHKCVSIRHALTAIRFGADVISMDGLECAVRVRMFSHSRSFCTCERIMAKCVLGVFPHH
jgi:hypothetical protein